MTISTNPAVAGISNLSANTASDGYASGLSYPGGTIPLRQNQLIGNIVGAASNLPAMTDSVSNGTFKSFGAALSAWGPFHAVKLIFANHTATPAVIDNACVAANATAYPSGTFNIANPSSGWSAATGQLTVPAATGATQSDRNKRPGMLVTAKIPLRSIPRAAGDLDGGLYELLFIRTVVLNANVTYTYGTLGAAFAAYWDPINEGFSVLTADPVFGVNTVTSPASVTTSTREASPALSPIGAIFYYDKKMTNIGHPGDSVAAGLQSAAQKLGASHTFKAAARIRAAGKMVAFHQCAISGSSMIQINAHGKDIVDQRIIDIMILHSHTINSAGTTAADWDSQWYYMMDLAQYHLADRPGNQVLILTPLPNDSFTSGQNIQRLIHRARVMACGLPYVDVESLAGTNGHWDNATYAGDGTHPSDAGFNALAALVQPALNALTP